jgi:monovalent cation:H+ antiporter-2, CPA2 family
LDERGFPYVVAEENRELVPNIEILLRTHNEEESELLRHEGVGKVFFGEEELAHGMASEALKRFAPQVGNRG